VDLFVWVTGPASLSRLGPREEYEEEAEREDCIRAFTIRARSSMS
jgi:hypothetical protein